MENVTFKYQLAQLVKQEETLKDKYALLESIQRHCEELKRVIAEKANVPFAEVVADEPLTAAE